MALWSNASILDRKIGGSRPAANSFFCKWTTLTRERRRNGDENKRARERTKRTTLTRERASERARQRTRSSDLSVNERLDSKDVECGMWNVD